MLFLYVRIYIFYLGKYIIGNTNVKSESLFTVMNNANAFINLGNIKNAGNLYEEYFNKYIENIDFQKSYLEYLIKIGDYDKIISFKNKKIFNNGYAIECINNAEKYKKIINEKNFNEISEIVKKSYYSVKIILLASELNLNNGINHNCILLLKQAENILNRFEDFNINDNEIINFKNKYNIVFGRYNFLNRDYENGIQLFKNILNLKKISENFEEVYNRYLKIKNKSGFYNLKEKLNEINNIYLNVIKYKVLDNFNPSIYKEFEIELLTFGIKEAIYKNQKGAYLMAKKLIEITENTETLELFLRCMIIERKSSIVISKFLDYALTKVKFNKQLINYFNDNIKNIEADELAENERKKQKEKEKNEEYSRRNDNNNRNRNFSRENNQKGDFLEYYKILNIKNFKATSKEITKAHRKSVRKANKIKDKKEKNDKLIKINKAADILSNEKTRALYDRGIDPDNNYSGYDNSNRYYENGGQFGFNNDDINDIFASFFGNSSRGSGKRGNSGYFRSNGRTYTFSSGF